uniref:Late embryogenesis abundant protein LEA-2 subgroup domain-containing protein n=1 Tax=Leersia perrieri TaxID=77586 RepID=A0A0D9XWI5_9ORYZ
MADRVHPMPTSPPPPPEHAVAAATETTPLHPSFRRPPPPSPGTYIVQIPKDQVLRVPPPDRARLYKKLAARPLRRRRLRRACCAAFCVFLLLATLAAAFATAVYLIFRPRSPSFSISSLSIRGLDATTQIDAAVRADNGGNKKAGIEYLDGGEIAVSYAGDRLAAGPWPAFRQEARNVTVFTAALVGEGVSFTDEQRKRLAAGAVAMTVEAIVPVRVRFGKVLRTWTVDVKARCDVTVDKLAGNATAASAGNRGCSVKVRPFWWWW